MLAAYAVSQSSTDPLEGLEVGERPDPQAPDGWVVVDLVACALNHHDVWSLRGVGLPADRLPMVLGCDGAGRDADGNEVIVHAVISDPDWVGDETLDPRRSLLSERHQGTFADQVAVPRRNVVPKSAGMTMAEAACLPTAWLTAYRMLFTQADLNPGDAVLVQGAGGGVATAAITLARAAGFRVFATSRDEDKRQRALDIGAHEALEELLETVRPEHRPPVEDELRRLDATVADGWRDSVDLDRASEADRQGIGGRVHRSASDH